MQEPQSPGSSSPWESGPGGEVPGTAPRSRRHTFPKEEHLCRKKLIEELFGKQSSSFGVYPLRLVYTKTAAPTTAPPQVLISVSKRSFKRAVDRNRLKRLIREAYRLHKYRLLEQPNGHQVALLGIIFTGKEKSPLALVEKKLISGILRLMGTTIDASAPPPAP
ncbi:ribonuclease P protein component [Hymenobacter properus]|uniref:Ribonuclease P protein component n=1 Tax=Hymenobacter properus TaxID=2791026 RepID=A0A931FJX0_9BACT|nr:ribonuclease P protein component [Hymenobacter properus]MBF9142378.1 ribonuclease P protein component [Hymenobacter properus]MBR7721185.1 ribonuclease P protein component [Microvirga sp. SRT04]